MAKQLTILGSTGSIGTNTLALVEGCPEQFDIKVLVAGRNAGLLAEQALRSVSYTHLTLPTNCVV